MTRRPRLGSLGAYTAYTAYAAVLVCSLAACGGGSSGGGGAPTGGGTPAPTAKPSPTPSPKGTPSPTPSPTQSPKPTPTPSATPTPTYVTVSPAAITFTQSGPGDYIVTVTGGSGSYVVGTDSCTSGGFAEWTQEPPPNANQYDVSYGVNIGQCLIQFVDQFNSNNYAYLMVDNQHNPHLAR